MAGCRPLTPVEAVQVAQAFGEDFYGVRNQTLFIVNLKTGFRISALLSLTVGDVCQQGEVVDYVAVHRRHQKQQTASHTVPLHQQAKQVLQRWLTVYGGRYTLHPSLVLFPSRKGVNRALTRVQAYQAYEQAYGACGLTGRLGTHACRKTFAKHVYERTGRNLFDTQQALGHKWITSTQAYLPVDDERIRGAILAS